MPPSACQITIGSDRRPIFGGRSVLYAGIAAKYIYGRPTVKAIFYTLGLNRLVTAWVSGGSENSRFKALILLLLLLRFP